MKLYHQLIVFVAASTVVPLVVGFIILRRSEQQLAARILEAREESAVRLAEVVRREVREVLERVQGALGYFDPGEVTAEELTGFLGILYKQSEDIVQVALLDEGGRQVVPGVYLDEPQRYPEYAGRLGVDAAAHADFLRRLPLEKAAAAPPGSVVVGRPYRLHRHATLGVAVVAPWTGTGSDGARLVAVELSLAPVIRRVLEAGQTRGFKAALVDDQGKAIAHPDQASSLARADLGSMAPVARLEAGAERGAFQRGEAVFAFARIAELGWGVVLTQPRQEAWAQVRKARRITLVWTGVSILALLGLGALFTGRITRNLRKVVTGAEKLGRGELGTRVELRSRDELGTLAATFNQMGEELEASRAEIEAWNRELARRVEERTRELEQAHRRLLETSKLAAIGQLGAGVAHEINNPLVGILGNVQLLIMKMKDEGAHRATLEKIEAAAKRCREVTQNLLRFSEQDANPEHVPCNLEAVLHDAFSLTEQRMREQGIQLRWQVADLPRVLGDHRQLMQVFFNLFANARVAMPDGGVLEVEAGPKGEEEIEVRVKDSGKGIPPEQLDRIFEPFFTTKDVWTNTGLGLSVSYRIVADHGGTIEVESSPGEGSLFRVRLPLVGETS